MADLVPNPLVTEVAKGLFHRGVVSLKDAVDAVKLAEAAAPVDEKTLGEKREALARQLAAVPRLPELIMFAGFVGGTVNFNVAAQNTTWRLLYLDAKLQTWMIVQASDIVFQRPPDKDVPHIDQRDLVWVKADASVSKGTGQPRLDDIQASYLRGDFTRAGDFAAGQSSGTVSPSAGLLSEARTPGCCGVRTR
jgi:hypothetical protein